MDFSKFVAMLSSNALWFSKAATFRDDPYEGFCLAEHSEFEDAAPGAVQLMALLGTHTARAFEKAREHLYVNCWTLDPMESVSMWER